MNGKSCKMNVKILRCHHISLFKFAGKHSETQPFTYLAHAQLKIFARSAKVINLFYKQHKNGFNLGKGTERVLFLVSVSLMFFWNMLRYSFHWSRSPSLVSFLLMASFLEQGVPLVSSLFSTSAKLSLSFL